MQLGTIVEIPPEAPREENTTWFPAGNLSIGIEYRRIDPDSLFAVYKDRPDLQEKLLAGGGANITDQGVSLHVRGDDGWEYLRFDAFEDSPHYHYIHNTGDPAIVRNQVIAFDATANGDMLPWALGRIREQLPRMLPLAGGAKLVPGLNRQAIDDAASRASALADEARRNAGRLREMLRDHVQKSAR